MAALVRESRNLNEYAFALGALPHYAADTNGHRIATVRAVPILYPELHRKFGRTATGRYNPLSHIRTEFGVDALQAAQGSYAPGSHSSGMADEERYARQRNSGRTVAAGTRSEGPLFHVPGIPHFGADLACDKFLGNLADRNLPEWRRISAPIFWTAIRTGSPAFTVHCEGRRPIGATARRTRAARTVPAGDLP